jgi:pimeloyl-ACP methyl ester carboxylesterase
MPEEREANRATIPDTPLEIVKNGGHFLSLDRPREIEQLILKFAS